MINFICGLIIQGFVIYWKGLAAHLGNIERACLQEGYELKRLYRAYNRVSGE